MDVFPGFFVDSDVMAWFLHRTSEINESPGEHPPWPDGLGKEIQFTVKGLKFSECAGSPATPPGHLIHELIDLFGGNGDGKVLCVDLYA